MSACRRRHEGAAKTEKGQPHFHAAVARESTSGDLVLKVVNATDAAQRTTLRLGGSAKLAATGSVIVLASTNVDAENALDAPRTIVPIEETMGGVTCEFAREFPAHSVTVLRNGRQYGGEGWRV